MNRSIYILILGSLISSCSVTQPVAVSDAYKPIVTHRVVPAELVDDLPSKIRRVPSDRKLKLVEFLKHTSLLPYSENIELSRHGYHMVLNSDRSLFIMGNRSQAITKTDVERYLVHLGGSSYDFPGWYFHLKGLAMVRL
jgi:hypothetical protein